MALFGKWLAKLLTEEGVWQINLMRKYVGLRAISRGFWKLGTLTFGKAWWQGRNTSSCLNLSLLRTDLRLGSRRTNGWVITRFENSIQLCIILWVIMVIP
jgi:hypothetical protein